MNEHITILFLTARQPEPAAADASDEWVRAGSLRAALGLYLDAAPHAVVIDSTHPDAEAVYLHLKSIGAGPIVILADQTAPWMLRQHALRQPDTWVVGRTQTYAALAECIRGLRRGDMLAFGGHRRTG
jgi:hypothetical protein